MQLKCSPGSQVLHQTLYKCNPTWFLPCHVSIQYESKDIHSKDCAEENSNAFAEKNEALEKDVSPGPWLL